MFTFFDYLFYRVYITDKKFNRKVMYRASATTSMIVCFFLMPILISFGLLFVGSTHLRDFSIPSCILIYFLMYRRFDKNINLIFQQFEYSKYNKQISNWNIWLCCAMMIIFGLTSTYLLGRLIIDTNLNGLLGYSLGII